MAKIGLSNFRYGLLTENEDGTATYGQAKTPAKAVECKVSIENYNAELYADDVLVESDYTFKKGTVNLVLDEEDDETYAEILGHEITEGEMVRKDTDIAPYIGFGRVLTKVVNGKYKYKVEFLHKVKFNEPAQEETTKGENIEFKTGALEGTVMKLKSGEWSKTKTFETKQEAITYLEGLFKKA